MKLGLCLSGGGVKGAAHIGAIKAFEEENINFEYIAGTSSGSIVATLYAAGYSSDEIYYIFKKYCRNIKYVDVLYVLKEIISLLFTRKNRIDGLNSGKYLEKIINKTCEKKNIHNINDIKKNLLIPSVEINTGIVYVFSSKENREYSDNTKYISDANIGKAVRASCSYPGIFSPCRYEDEILVDGGIRENTPWRELKESGAEKIVSIIFEKNTKNNKCKNIIEVVTSSLELISRELSKYELDGADCLIKIKTKNIQLLDMKQIEFLYEEGYKQTKQKIEEIKKYKDNVQNFC